VGIIAGWLAGKVVQGAGFGLIWDLIVGLIGAFIGDWLLPRLGIHLGTGIVALIVNAFIGAVVLLRSRSARCPAANAPLGENIPGAHEASAGQLSVWSAEPPLCIRAFGYRVRVHADISRRCSSLIKRNTRLMARKPA